MNFKIMGNAVCLLLLLLTSQLKAQTIDIDGLKDILKAKPFAFSGGVTASNVFYSGTGNYGRNPYSYFLQGNLNVNILGKINLPFSFSLTNSGAGYSYPTPPNRLSLHPKYKWMTGHIGDVAMSFSPYTLNGHQFSGAGVDLTPDGPWKFSAMVGRLQKATPYDSTNYSSTATFKRMGYGGKVSYEKEFYKIGLSALYAKDDLNSLTINPVNQPIYPQQNIAVSYTLQVRPMKGLELNAEYGNSAITQDERDTLNYQSTAKGGYLRSILGKNKGSAFYQALKAGMNYTYKKSTLGIGFERIDPRYRTLGAYYFNNDLENITVNVSQSLLNDKASIAASIGLQRDNLNSAKSGTTKRTVGSINLNYSPTEKLQFSGSYSNFQTFMNMRSQFQQINQATPYQNLDTLNFTQLSQNANLAVGLVTKKNDNQNHQLSINLSFQDASDEQGGIVRKGNSSQFYNLATGYNILLLKAGIGLTASYNLSYNTIARNEMLTHGPTLAATAKLFDKKMTTGLSVSYNTSLQEQIEQSNVFNVRFNSSYTLLKKHNLNFSLINQYRSMLARASTTDLTGTLGYSYSF